MKLTQLIAGAAAVIGLLQGGSCRHLPLVDPLAHYGTKPADVIGNALRNQTYANIKRDVLHSITDERFTYLVQQGCNLLQAMSKTDKEAAEYMTLPAEGYVPDDLAELYLAVDNCPHVDDALVALGYKALSRKNEYPHKLFAPEHIVQTEHDGVTYMATHGHFRNFLNVEDGVIIRWSNYGPRYAAEMRVPPVTVLPKLRNWNDVIYLGWKQQADELKKDGGKLRLVIAAHVLNRETLGIIDRALKAAGHAPPAGEDFDPDGHCEHYTWKEGRHQYYYGRGKGIASVR
ncbi:hypothetical protein M011DRAFT_483385 [Sporormia fimetaria CBS 119925]|uniref:Uncharacterized protein n=1 Tax=Sporormia fimetaria CBS 119925 TaxID=1340428 RepID=A0A6A6VNZ6_9PLEO|nr:hypothetical protein M011DRAFT_483385 [Sporormia fimetaria CBS 119925]